MNQALLDRVLKNPRLPTLPSVAMSVTEQCRQDDINIKQIAKTISNDPALSTKILKTVNSSYYGLSQRVSNISHALVILGLNSVKTLALGFSIVGEYIDVGGSKFDMNQIWRRCLYSAVAARSIAGQAGLAHQEEAFLGGLLQDIGEIALIQTLGAPYIQIVNQVGQQHDRLITLEQEQFGLDHTQVGEALAAEYKLPDVLAGPVRYHEKPEEAPAELSGIVHAVTLGGHAADVFLQEPPHEAVQRYFEQVHAWFELERAAASNLLERINTGTREMAKLLDISTGQTREPGEILAEANEVLLQLSLKTQLNATQLEQQNKQLQHQATTDPLTGAANRGRFNDFLCDAFDYAKRQMEPLGLILMDVDYFKNFNDTHGHMVGDRVLVTLANLLNEQCPERALAARYGGEEFAIILPGTSRVQAAQFAEQVRVQIERARVETEDHRRLHVTASIGVAGFDGVRFFNGPQQLIKAADRAVYAAKDAGRNCVRAFRPKGPGAETTPHANASPPDREPETSGAG